MITNNQNTSCVKTDNIFYIGIDKNAIPDAISRRESQDWITKIDNAIAELEDIKASLLKVKK